MISVSSFKKSIKISRLEEVYVSQESVSKGDSATRAKEKEQLPSMVGLMGIRDKFEVLRSKRIQYKKCMVRSGGVP